MLDGLKQKDIAKKIGVDETTISVWKDTDIFTAELQRQNKEKFKYMAVEAAKQVKKLMQSSKNDSVKATPHRKLRAKNVSK